MDDVGCYVAFPEVRIAILVATALLIGLIVSIAEIARRRVARRAEFAMTGRCMEDRGKSAPLRTDLSELAPSPPRVIA